MVRLTDRPDMTLDVYVDAKQQYNNNKVKDLESQVITSSILIRADINSFGKYLLLWKVFRLDGPHKQTESLKSSPSL